MHGLTSCFPCLVWFDPAPTTEALLVAHHDDKLRKVAREVGVKLGLCVQTEIPEAITQSSQKHTYSCNFLARLKPDFTRDTSLV